MVLTCSISRAGWAIGGVEWKSLGEMMGFEATYEELGGRSGMEGVGLWKRGRKRATSMNGELLTPLQAGEDGLGRVTG